MLSAARLPVALPGSSVAKFNRAQLHFQTLQLERDTFYGPDAYTIRCNSDDDYTKHLFYVEFVRDPPYDDFGLIFGDGVHNLRSALDHAVYAIGIRETGDAPRDGKRLQFLITQDDTKWKEVAWQIKSLSSPAQAAIKGLQPRGYTDEFALTPLGGLQEFDNSDKHRIVRIVTSFIREAEAPLTGLPAGTTANLTWHFGPVKPDAPIMTLVTREAAPDVKMHKGLTFDIALPYIRERGQEAVLPIWETVDAMNQAVRVALKALAPFC
jgi:hypothetical protein